MQINEAKKKLPNAGQLIGEGKIIPASTRTPRFARCFDVRNDACRRGFVDCSNAKEETNEVTGAIGSCYRISQSRQLVVEVSAKARANARVAVVTAPPKLLWTANMENDLQQYRRLLHPPFLMWYCQGNGRQQHHTSATSSGENWKTPFEDAVNTPV